MILSETTYIRKTPELVNMLKAVTDIYNKTLFHLRNSYFEQKEKGEKIKLIPFKELYKIVTNEDCWKNSNSVDTYAKGASMKLAVQNFKSYFAAKRSYNKNSRLFKGKPKIPDFVKGKYISVTFDKTRLGKGRGKKKLGKYQYGFHKSKTVISLSKRFEKSQIRNVSFNQICGKIKVTTTYEVPDEEIKENESMMGIDIGLANLVAISSNDKCFSYIVKGGVVKSISQFYHKRRAQIQGQLKTCNKKKQSKRLDKVTHKRNNKMKNYLHKVSKVIVQKAVDNDVSKIVIGKNKYWKQTYHKGKINNQNFISAPFETLIHMIRYKGALNGISVVTTEESYTSQADHSSLEKMTRGVERKGKRTKRGLFITSEGRCVNSDINGAIGMMRKANGISDAQLLGLRDRGDIVSPRVLKFNP